MGALKIMCANTIFRILYALFLKHMACIRPLAGVGYLGGSESATHPPTSAGKFYLKMGQKWVKIDILYMVRFRRSSFASKPQKNLVFWTKLPACETKCNRCS